MIKVFISQPMRDKTDEEIKAERNEIKKHLEYIYNERIHLNAGRIP